MNTMNRIALLEFVSILGFVSIFSSSGCAQKQDNLDNQAAPPPPPSYVYFIHPAREGFIENPTKQETQKVGQHFEYLKRLTAEGKVLLAGPSTDPPYTGIIIFNAPDRKAAEALMKNDPAVRAGVFRGRCSPMRLSLIGNLEPTPME